MRPSARFQPLRSPSLHRLRTAFSLSSHPTPFSSNSAATSASSSASTSPLTRTSSPLSASSASSSIRAALMLRRRPSGLDREMEEERQAFGTELEMLEPRPQPPMAIGGIFEVLDGRV